MSFMKSFVTTVTAAAMSLSSERRRVPDCALVARYPWSSASRTSKGERITVSSAALAGAPGARLTSGAVGTRGDVVSAATCRRGAAFCANVGLIRVTERSRYDARRRRDEARRLFKGVEEFMGCGLHHFQYVTSHSTDQQLNQDERAPDMGDILTAISCKKFCRGGTRARAAGATRSAASGGALPSF